VPRRGCGARHRLHRPAPARRSRRSPPRHRSRLRQPPALRRGRRAPRVERPLAPTDKAVVLERLAAELGVAPAQTMYVGDSRDDLPAVRWSGIGVFFDNVEPPQGRGPTWSSRRSGSCCRSSARGSASPSPSTTSRRPRPRQRDYGADRVIFGQGASGRGARDPVAEQRAGLAEGVQRLDLEGVEELAGEAERVVVEGLHGGEPPLDEPGASEAGKVPERHARVGAVELRPRHLDDGPLVLQRPGMEGTAGIGRRGRWPAAARRRGSWRSAASPRPPRPSRRGSRFITNRSTLMPASRSARQPARSPPASPPSAPAGGSVRSPTRARRRCGCSRSAAARARAPGRGSPPRRAAQGRGGSRRRTSSRMRSRRGRSRVKVSSQKEKARSRWRRTRYSSSSSTCSGERQRTRGHISWAAQ